MGKDNVLVDEVKNDTMGRLHLMRICLKLVGKERFAGYIEI